MGTQSAPPAVNELGSTEGKMNRQVHDIDFMYSRQRLSDLRRLAVRTQLRMSNEAFLSKGGSREQKIQEALVGATFLCVFQRIVSPVMGRMAKINEEALDMEATGLEGTSYPFEITTAYPPDYRILERYKNGKQPEIPRSAFTGEPKPAEWIASAIINKTVKIRGKGMRRHLIVYDNIAGGTTDLWRLPSLLEDAAVEWDSIWLITGVPDIGWVALVSGIVRLKSSMPHEKASPILHPLFWSYRIDRAGLRIFEQPNRG